MQYLIIYVLNIEDVIKKTVKDLKEFIFENYYKRINFAEIDWKRFGLFAEKSKEKRFGNIWYWINEKISDPTKAKEYYN